MKLLQISIEVNSNSVGRIAEQIGQTALDAGWESYITYARSHQPSKSTTIKIGNKLDVMVHGLRTRIFDDHCLASTRATRKLVKQIDEKKPDIILLHHIHGYYLNMKILFEYLSKTDIPVVWIQHDCWNFTGHCAYFDLVGCDKWKTECYRCPQKKLYPASFLLDRSRSNYHLKKKLFNSLQNLTIISVSYWLQNLVEASFLSGHSSKVIYNGIDVQFFAPISNDKPIREKYDVVGKFVVLGVAGVWSVRKGLADFIQLSKMLDRDTKIILVGLSKKQIASLPENIIGLKRTENVQQLVELYSMADIFFNPSVEETFGLTTAEALACGTPALVYNATASPEVVSSDTGFIVAKHDLEAVLYIIKQAKETGKHVYSEKCRERAVTCFNKDDRFREYIELFTSLIENNK